MALSLLSLLSETDDERDTISFCNLSFIPFSRVISFYSPLL